MLSHLLLSLGALAAFANGQSSTGAPNATSSSSSGPQQIFSSGLVVNFTSSSPLINVTSSTGIIGNITSSTGILGNITSSTGILGNITSSTGILGNLTSSTGIVGNISSSGGVIPPPILSSTGASGVTQCGGAGFDLSSIANMDLTVEQDGYTWAIRPCGTVNGDLDLCDGQMCQDDVVISRYEPTLVNWYQIPNGVNLEVQNGDDDGCPSPRESDINFICNITQTTPRLVSISEPTTCKYRAIVHTAAACTRNSTYQPGIGDAFLSTVCGGGAYDLQSISNMDITTQVGTWNWTINPCGLVREPRCAAAQPASICQWQQTGNVWKLADITHDVPLYEINANGLNMSLESGTPCGNANRTTLVQFECDPLATTPALVEAYEYYGCEYWFRVRTNAVCGAPFQIRPVSSSSGLPVVQSSSSSSALPTGLPGASSSSSTGLPIIPGSSSSTGLPIEQPSSSTGLGPILSSSVTTPPIFESSSEQFPEFSSTADENIEDPGVNGANMASVSGVAVIVSLMAVAVAL